MIIGMVEIFPGYLQARFIKILFTLQINLLFLEGYNNSSTKIVPTNSVLIALAGQGKTRGTVAINKIELCTNQSIASIIPNEMLNYKYLFYYLESKYEYLRALSSSDGGRGGLNLKLIRSIPIQVPSIKEQENISNFINEIDKKILLLEQKHKLYDDFKKYLMQQIFTQKLRFDYDMIKLKDICKINKGKQLNKDAMIENGKYYVLNGGKEPSGYTNEWNTSENTITISEGGNSCGYVNFNTEKFWSGGHCYYLSNLHENVDDYYLYSYLKFKEEFIMRLRVGSGLPNIQKGDIENIKIQIVSKIIKIKLVIYYYLLIKRLIQSKSKKKILKTLRRTSPTNVCCTINFIIITK